MAKRYIEFFPKAKQEYLFIGMIQASAFLGLPQNILTDNMKSVVTSHTENAHPVWNHEYENFMRVVGFRTVLYKPRHLFTKGKVERLIRFVMDNFLTSRLFSNMTEPNMEALRLYSRQNGIYHKTLDCVPDEMHALDGMNTASVLVMTEEFQFYLCPERRISFDGKTSVDREYGLPWEFYESWIIDELDKIFDDE